MASGSSNRRPACITKKGVCPCTVYTFIEGEECEECEHLPKHHLTNQQSIRRRKSYEDEVHLEVSSSPKATIPRKDTVMKLHSLMCKYSLVHVRATPGSGKTTLLKLLRCYCLSKESDFDVVCLIAGWTDEQPADYYKWLEFFAQRISFGVTTDELRSSQPDSRKIAILLDEGQNSYHDFQLWHTFIKTDLKRLPNIKVVVASCYGSTSDGDMNENRYRGPAAPDFLEDDQVVQLYALPPKPGVFFTKDEFRELENMFAKSTNLLKLPTAFRHKLFDLTGGHCGAVFDFLNYIFSSSAAKKAMFENTRARIPIFNVRDMENLNEIIPKMTYRRGLPNQSLPGKADIAFTEQIRKVLRRIVSDGQMPVIPFNPKHAEFFEAVRICESKGWITKEFSSPSTRSKFYAFPTGLHHWWFEYQFFKEAPPIPTAITLEELVFAAIPLMSKSLLQKSEQARVRHANPEATYQNEIYRIIFLYTRGAAAAAPEVFVGQGNRPGEKGRLDFLIKFRLGTPQKYWGIEALVDESGFEEHSNRYKPNGKYASASGLDDYILLNFQKFPPKCPYPKVRKAWTVVFNADFTELVIYNATTATKSRSFHTSP